jgi:hypothetical protein
MIKHRRNTRRRLPSSVVPDARRPGFTVLLERHAGARIATIRSALVRRGILAADVGGRMAALIYSPIGDGPTRNDFRTRVGGLIRSEALFPAGRRSL